MQIAKKYKIRTKYNYNVRLNKYNKSRKTTFV